MVQKASSVEEYFNEGIRHIITQFPKIRKILEEYNIDCVICSEGVCLLKDIVKIHNLNQENERILINKIEEIVDSGKITLIPHIIRKETKSREIKYSPPVRKLVDENNLIKRWIVMIPKIIECLDLNSDDCKQLLFDGIEFIRSYADGYHHIKEEEELFKYFDGNLDILKKIVNEHEKIRFYVRILIYATEEKDKPAVEENLYVYKELLTEHMKKEEEILYPWIDKNLTMAQIGEVCSKFNEIDKKFQKVSKKHKEFIEKLEDKYN